MKIAFIVDSFPKLSETFILNQITGLIQRGHDVRVFSREAGDEGVLHSDIDAYGLLDRIEYYGDAIVRAPEEKMARVIQATKIFFNSNAQSRSALLKSMNPARLGKDAISLTTFYTILPFLNRELETFDIVHCHFGPFGGAAALLKASGVINGALVTTFHGYDITRYVRQRGRGVYKNLFKYGDCFMPISERWRNELMSLGCPDEKTIVHHMGVDLDKFSFLPRDSKDDQGINIVSIARLVEKKGIEYGVRAVAKVLPRFPEIRYRIIGDGPLRNSIQGLIDELGVSAQVEIVGWRSQDEILSFMKAADMLLAPSVTSAEGDQEGIPVVLMEALALGIPVVSTQHSGIPELIGDGESGYLVPERDVDALTDKLLTLFKERWRWHEMGLAGRKRVANDFNIDHLNDSLVKIYEGLVD